MNKNTKQSKALVKTDVSSSLSISEIKERLDNCIDLYTDLFCQKQEVYADGWIGEIKGGINCFSDAFLSFEDIRIDLENNAPKGEIFKWFWENVESNHSINYHSYLKGLRVSDLKDDKKCKHKNNTHIGEIDEYYCNDCFNLIYWDKENNNYKL